MQIKAAHIEQAGKIAAEAGPVDCSQFFAVTLKDHVRGFVLGSKVDVDGKPFPTIQELVSLAEGEHGEIVGVMRQIGEMVKEQMTEEEQMAVNTEAMAVFFRIRISEAKAGGSGS